MGIPSREEIYCALEQRHGAELQKKLSSAAVAICGLGGLGSNIAVCLVRAGVGRLHIIDFDKVDITNVNRQQYFLEQLGQNKTDALKDTLGRINPYCEIITDCVKLTYENIPHILSEDDIICEAFDKAENKAELVNCVLENMREKYVVAASGMAGTGAADKIRTRRIMHHFYICGDLESDIADGMGLVSSRVMVCAAHQAHKVIQLIEKGES